MINFLLGSPGAGKSYEAVVFHILPALNSGRKVITNLPLNISAFESICPGSTELIEIIENKVGEFAFSKVDHYSSEWRDDDNRGPLYVIDEAHKPLPRSSMRNANQSRELAEWYAEHRHLGVDVLLITQSYGKINRDIVDLCQVVWRCRKNIALGSKSTYVRKTIDGIRGAEIATVVRKYKPEYFKLYQSHTASNGSVNESGASEVRPIWRHWSVYGAGIFLFLAGYLALTGGFNPFPEQVIEPESVTISKHSQHRPSVPPVRQTSSRPISSSSDSSAPKPLPEKKEEPETHHPFESLKLHAGGVISAGGRQVALFVASQNGQRVFTLRKRDLEKTGYTVEYLSDCAWRIAWGDTWEQYITCDNPTVGISTMM